MDKITHWFRAKMRAYILSLVACDIEDIARRSYDDGCYVTTKRLKAEEQMRLAHLIAENEHLRKMLVDRLNIDVPKVHILAGKP